MTATAPAPADLEEPATQQDIKRQDLTKGALLSYIRDFEKRVNQRFDGIDDRLNGLESKLDEVLRLLRNDPD